MSLIMAVLCDADPSAVANAVSAAATAMLLQGTPIGACADAACLLLLLLRASSCDGRLLASEAQVLLAVELPSLFTWFSGDGVGVAARGVDVCTVGVAARGVDPGLGKDAVCTWRGTGRFCGGAAEAGRTAIDRLGPGRATEAGIPKQVQQPCGTMTHANKSNT